MDIVFITDLRVETIIGIYDWEREQKQTLSVDLAMGWDIRRAAQTEDIDDALNYKAVSKRVEAFMLENHFLLVETMAESLARLIMTEYSVPWLRLTLHKPGALSNSRDVGIVIERGQKF